METHRKRHLGNSVPRAVFVAVSVILQLGWLLMTALVLNEKIPWISAATRILSLALILHLNSRQKDAAYKMPWIMLILAFPVMGVCLYLMMDVFADLGKIGRRLKTVRETTRPLLSGSGPALSRLQQQKTAGSGLGTYLQQAGCPVYENTAAEYFSEAGDAFAAMKRDLEKAESFIFMEYFIVSGDPSFQELAQILIRKAQEGVDVRFMYDDVGSVGYVNMLFARDLSRAGIPCMVFNPAMPVLNLFMNHRDHRKITVIDGKVGYTGGFNLADEYFGRKITFGRWKDTGLRLEGDAVKSLTAAFLEIWNACSRKPESPEPFLSVRHSLPGQQGFVQPYEDDPLSPERVAENVYLNLIYSATQTLYVTTPYLIITDEMANALTMAAKRGVDVRIITPGVPDKKIIYRVTRSYYAGLAAGGVRIFEYTPGFCHAKQMLCDGTTASIGTSNLDYRSLYLHFENNVLLYGGPAVEQMEKDFEQMFCQCREVTEKYRGKRSRALRLGQYILRLFAPLL